MFESLKKKLKSWLGSSEEKETKPEPKKEEKKVKEKPVKASSKKSEKKQKESQKALKQQPKADTSKPVAKPVQEIEEVEEITEPVEETPPIIEEIEEKEEKENVGFFARLKNKLTGAKITQEEFEEIFYELELALLENNVALEVVDKIREDLQKSLVGSEAKKSEIEKTISTTLKKSIEEVLIEPPNLIQQIKDKKGVFTIIFFGINGTGKTTSIAKLAYKLKKEGISCVLAAADTFRAAAIEQIETHAKKIGVPLIKHDYNADPAAVAFEAKSYAEKNNIKCVLIDTAGRMYTKENLMKQMEKIIRIGKPDLKIFVGESITGNDAIEQAKTFNETVGLDGMILSKADVDEKGGTALSVSYVTKKPIYFLGVGQTYDDLEVFKKEIILKNLGLE